MTQTFSKRLDSLAVELSEQYASLTETGRRTIDALRTSDPALVEELIATFEAEGNAARWVASRTIGFGGLSAVELLARGERELVLQVLHQLRYGLCA